MIKVRAHTCYLGKTGFAAHSRGFFRELSKYVDLRVRNYTWDDKPDYLDSVDESIIDTITLSNGENSQSDYPIEHSFPNRNWLHSNAEDFTPDVDIVLMDINHYYFYEEYTSPIKIAFTVWESTELEEGFFNQLLKFDYVWVVTDWHRKMIIDQGYPAYRVFVVNEGVDSSLYNKKPSKSPRDKFEFMFFGRWDYRKSLPEIVKSFIDAFPDNDEVELILSADNPYSIDGFNSTEERLLHYGLVDDRIKVKHFLNREDYEDYIKNGHVLITCARSEGWNIPLIEAMVSGTPVIYSNWGAQLEFAEGRGNPVRIKEEKPASIGADLGFARNTPGLYAEPDFEDLKRVMIDCFENWGDKKSIAMKEADEIYNLFNWENIGRQGYESLLKVSNNDIEKPHKDDCVVILSHADSKEKLSILKRSILTLKRQGYFIVVSSHISIPDDILNICDYFICETDNPIVTHDEYPDLSNTVPVHYLKYPDFDLSYSFDFNHGYAALRLILNGSKVSKMCGFRKTHFVNYDYVIDDENTLLEHSIHLDNNSIVGYRWDTDRSINSAFFSGINEDVIRSLEDTDSKKKYFKYEGIVILEDFLYKVFEDSGLSMRLGSVQNISRKNILNSVILLTYPQIKTKNGKSSYLYLSKELSENRNYICAIGNEEPLEGKIIKGDKAFEFSVGAYPMQFYPVTEDELERGVTVLIPKYNHIFKYNKETKKAALSIKNRSLIIEPKIKTNPPQFNINFIDGPFIEIKNAGDRIFDVLFIDQEDNKIYYSCELKNNMWARSSIKYYKKWLIKIIDRSTGETFEEKIDLSNKKVLISLESSSLGDSIAWFPHIDEFRKLHGCNVVVSTFKNELFKNKYPNIDFVNPGHVVNGLYAIYKIGWFYKGENFNPDLNPRDFKNLPLQSTSTDILGLNYTSLRPNINFSDTSRPIQEKYVCIGIHSTAQAKYWNNPKGWQELVDWFISKGNKVVLISREMDGYMGNKTPEGVIRIEGEKTLDNAIRYLKNCEMFVGIGSGLSWLSWSLNVPTVLISGFSNPITEFFDDNVLRIFNPDVCNSCFNRERLDAGDWNWCPDHKGTNRQFECTKSISGEYVIRRIEAYISGNNEQTEIERVIQESYNLGMVQNHKEIFEASKFFKSLKVKNFMEIGTDQGGTFAIWSKLSEDGIRISVDLPHGQFGRADYDEYKRDEYLISLGSNVYMFWGSSHDDKMLKDVEDIIGEELLDFLFIDGDHTYEGVKDDYEMYKHLVRPGGWIGFHDIKNTEFHTNANCRVDLLWSELEGEKIEFLDNSSEYGGIGFIRV
jgi:autotransporter strand-loop-strand O-heptosyltransferase